MSRHRPARWRALVAAAALAWAAGVAADPAGAAPSSAAPMAPLTLDAVLASSREQFPAVLAARQKVRAQAGKLLTSEGAFDAYVEQGNKSRLSGYYDGRSTSTKVLKPLGPLSADVYGSYRVSGGDFPIYEDEAFTLDAGEFKLGAVFSLLRDRDIDARRAGLRDSTLGLQQSELDAMLTRIRVQHDAMQAYVDWVAAGESVKTYRDLLALAEARDEGMQTRVAEGDLAAVFLNENRQNILRRKSFLLEAERKLVTATNRLSLYLRDARGAPRLATEQELPGQWPSPPTLVDPTTIDASIRAALGARPEVGVLAADIERERLNLALGENLLKPRVDVGVELARDFGSGQASRTGTDTILRLDVTVPIETRTARGRIDSARANLDRLALDRQLLDERIEVEVRTLANDLAAAYRFVELARQEVEQAGILAQAERERFREGASDFFLVNLREEAAANAQVREIEARQRYLGALADFYAATVQRQPLGLGAG